MNRFELFELFQTVHYKEMHLNTILDAPHLRNKNAVRAYIHQPSPPADHLKAQQKPARYTER